jgi:hypothetical protein
MGISKVRDDFNFSTYLIQDGEAVNATIANKHVLALKDEMNFIGDIIKCYEGFELFGDPNAWNSAVTYHKGYVVLYNGVRYMCLSDNNLNITPTNTQYWKVVKVLNERFLENFGTGGNVEFRPNLYDTRFLLNNTELTLFSDLYVKTDDGLSNRFSVDNAGATTVHAGDFIVNNGNIGTLATSNLQLGYANTTSNIGVGSALTSGTVSVGSVAGTGNLSFGVSTKTQTINIGAGATENTLTKTINIGTGSVAGSTTNINFGAVGLTASIIANANMTLTGDIAVNGGDLTSTATTFNLLNNTVTTLNLAGASTAVNIGASTGTTAIKNNGSVAGTLAITGITSISNTTDSTSKDTGCLVVEGGVGIEKNLTVGVNASVSGTLTTTGVATFNNGIKTTQSNVFVGSLTSTSDAEQILLNVSPSLYRSIEMFIQITQGTSYHSTKLLIIHDGTNAHITEFGSIMTVSTLGFFRADITGGELRVYVDPVGAANTVIKYHAIIMNI